MTILTPELIRTLPGVNIHVHAPGTITPRTALRLGLKNNLITIKGDKIIPTAKLPDSCPFRGYDEIFNVSVKETPQGRQWDIKYNLPPRDFQKFDLTMALVQGHRHGIGGIMSAEDYVFSMQEYKKACLENNLKYVELQQNVEIAYAIYPNLSAQDARYAFYDLLMSIVFDFARDDIDLRFANCYNKHAKASGNEDVVQNSIKAAKYLIEARDRVAEVFVALQSAGSEKMAFSAPELHAKGYELAAKEGFVLDGHAGEGIGVGYLKRTFDSLKTRRIGHGFQIIESHDQIKRARDEEICLVSMPSINQFLGAKVSVDKSGRPLAEENGGTPTYIESIWSHPFFPLLREHGLKMALATDNPGLGGVPVQQMLMQLSGNALDVTGEIPLGFQPLTAEESALCFLNAIDASGCNPVIKSRYVKHMHNWLTESGISGVKHELLESYKGGRLGFATINSMDRAAVPLR